MRPRTTRRGAWRIAHAPIWTRTAAQCHRPGGTVADFDARYTTPLAKQNLINGAVVIDENIDRARVIAPNDIWRSILFMRVNTNDSIRMPPLARMTIDEAGVNLLQQWIHSMPGPPVLAPPNISPAGGSFDKTVTVTLLEAEPGAVIHYTLGWQRTDHLRPGLRRAFLFDRIESGARAGLQTGVYAKHHCAAGFCSRRLAQDCLRSIDFATTATPQGLPPAFTRATSFAAPRSTTETSLEGPFAVKRYFPSGDIAIPHGLVPTLIVLTTA